MRILPKEASRFDIPLCRMVHMPLVYPTLSRGWRLSSSMDIILEHPYSMFPLATCMGMSGLWRMKIPVSGNYIGPQWTMSLKPCWLQTLTSSSFVVLCFLFAMGTIGSRNGQATLVGCIRMTESGITLWTTFALTQKARVAYYWMPCTISTSKSFFSFYGWSW
jgi:hypothetical protein